MRLTCYDIRSTTKDDHLQVAIAATLSQSLSLHGPGVTGVAPGPSVEGLSLHTIPRQAQMHLRSSKELLRQYENIDGHILAVQNLAPAVESSQGEVEWLKRILGKQASRVKQQITALLCGDNHLTGEDQNPEVSSEKGDIWDLFAGVSTKGVEESVGRAPDTWAVTAKRAEKGIRQLVKYFSDEEIES